MDDTDDGREPRVRRLPFTWLGLLAAGWVVYEITAQPALGTALICLKFGWADFRTARWLRRTDPDRVRGRACFWLYAAWGMWKAAAVALLTSVVIIIGLAVLSDQKGPNNGQPPGVDQLWRAGAGVSLVIGVGFVLASLAGMWAALLAWHHGIRLWLHGYTSRAAQDGIWPPEGPLGAANRVNVPLATAVFALSYTVVGTAIALGLRGPGDVFVMAAFWPTFLVGAFLAHKVSLSITASCPADCWPTEPVDPAPADPVGW